MSRSMGRHFVVMTLLACGATVAGAQQDHAPGVLPGVKFGGSPNVKVLGHIPPPAFLRRAT